MSLITHLCRMDFPMLINGTSPFPSKSCWVVFSFYSNLIGTFRKQTVETLIRRRSLQCLHMSNKKDAWFKSRNTLKIDLDHLHVLVSFHNYFADFFRCQLSYFGRCHVRNSEARLDFCTTSSICIH